MIVDRSISTASAGEIHIFGSAIVIGKPYVGSISKHADSLTVEHSLLVLRFFSIGMKLIAIVTRKLIIIIFQIFIKKLISK